ncbi:MAG: cytochrome c, partial [Geobacteraceae bacterium]|nr:cytochrome c [Geobacteraceae bacterium]
MKCKNIFISFFVLLSATGFLYACGGGGDTAASSSAVLANVSGVAATGSAIQGRVYLKDSSGAVEQVADTDADGAFSFNVADLKAPFLLKAVWDSTTGSHELYSFSEGAGRANVNPLTNAAVVAAAGLTENSALDQGLTEVQMNSIKANLPGVIASLREKLAPLFDMYNADINPVTGTIKADHTGFDAM